MRTPATNGTMSMPDCICLKNVTASGPNRPRLAAAERDGVDGPGPADVAQRVATLAGRRCADRQEVRRRQQQAECDRQPALLGGARVQAQEVAERDVRGEAEDGAVDPAEPDDRRLPREEVGHRHEGGEPQRQEVADERSSTQRTVTVERQDDEADGRQGEQRGRDPPLAGLSGGTAMRRWRRGRREVLGLDAADRGRIGGRDLDHRAMWRVREQAVVLGAGAHTGIGSGSDPGAAGREDGQERKIEGQDRRRPLRHPAP